MQLSLKHGTTPASVCRVLELRDAAATGSSRKKFRAMANADDSVMLPSQALCERPIERWINTMDAQMSTWPDKKPIARQVRKILRVLTNFTQTAASIARDLDHQR